MKIRTSLRAMLAPAILAVLVGCASSTRASHQPRTTNIELEQSVRNQMATNAQLSKNVRVNVDASKNLVTLSGTVSTDALRAKAVALAEETAADLNVIDDIEVKAVVPSPKQFRDTQKRQGSRPKLNASPA